MNNVVHDGIIFSDQERLEEYLDSLRHLDEMESERARYEEERPYEEWKTRMLDDNPDLTEEEVSEAAFADWGVAEWERIHDL